MFAEVTQQASEAKKQEEAKAELDRTDWKLRVRLMWLNNEGGFANQINYRRVKSAATGLPCDMIMTVMKEAQQRRQEQADPTQFICDLLNGMRVQYENYQKLVAGAATDAAAAAQAAAVAAAATSKVSE